MDPNTAARTAITTDDPKEGLHAVVELHNLANRLEFQHVEHALRCGMSWQDIANILGVSRQAVHKKYAKRIDPSIPIPRRRT